MHRIHVKKARTEDDFKVLCAINKAAFPATDVFDISEWKELGGYILYCDNVPIGTTALCRHKYWNWDKDVYVKRRGCLYVANTAVIPERQGEGWGRYLKDWQMAYARRYGYTHLKITTREGNIPMRKLNESVGFKIIGYIFPAYKDPDERGVDMELWL